MIIGINGKINSGKDTIGKIVQFLVANENLPKDMQYQSLEELDNGVNAYSNWEIKKFAGKLKTIASLLTGIPVESFEDQEFKKALLGAEWGTVKTNPLNAIPVFGDVQFNELMSVRELLQRLGTEAMRDGLHTNVWVNALFADYKQTWNDPDPIPDNDYTITWRENYTDETTLIHYGKGSEAEVFEYEINNPNWIITDMRFPNEMKAVVERKGITIRVNRNNGTRAIDVNPHPSETALDNAEFDYVIENDGTIEDLVTKVREILTKENII